MRPACLRWTEEGRENFVCMSASMSETGHQMIEMASCLLDEDSGVVAFFSMCLDFEVAMSLVAKEMQLSLSS
jgi:hypothetical protein